MDAENLADLRRLAPDEAARAKVRLLRSFDPAAPAGAEVPDPYFGGHDGLPARVRPATRACEGLLTHLRAGRLAGA